MHLPRALRAFLQASLIFTLLCAGIEAFCRWILRWPTPWDYPLIRNVVRFPDFHYFISKFGYFHSAAFYTQSYVLPYPAPTLVAMKLFLLPQPSAATDGWAILRYQAAILLTAAILLGLFWRALVRLGLLPASASFFCAGLVVFGFPFAFEFSQGNIEWAVWVVMMIGLWGFFTGRQRVAAVCFGVAGSMKIFPIIFIGLFLAARRFRAILLALVSATVSTVISLWLVCPDFGRSARETAGALGVFAHEHMAQIRPLEGGFDHSLFALIKLILNAGGRSQEHDAGLGIYLSVAAVSGCVLFFLRIRKLPLPNQVLCLTVAAIVLPPVSYDYTLLHLYAPLALFAFVALGAAQREAPAPKGLLTMLLLLAFVLAPESEFLLHGVRYAGQLKCFALLALGGFGLRYPVPVPTDFLVPVPRRVPASRIAAELA